MSPSARAKKNNQKIENKSVQLTTEPSPVWGQKRTLKYQQPSKERCRSAVADFNVVLEE